MIVSGDNEENENHEITNQVLKGEPVRSSCHVSFLLIHLRCPIADAPNLVKHRRGRGSTRNARDHLGKVLADLRQPGRSWGGSWEQTVPREPQPKS